MKDVM